MTNTDTWGSKFLKRTVVVCTLLGAVSLSPWGYHADVIPDAWATVTDAVQVPDLPNLTEAFDTIRNLRDGVTGIGDIEDRMVEDVAEQCAIVIASGMDDTCDIALTTPAEEAARFEQLLEAMEGN